MEVSKEVIISSVFRYPALWDPSHKDHKDRNIVQKIWRELGRELGTDEDNLKTKWRGLRDYYRKELKRIGKPRGGQGVDDVNQSNWPLFNLLSFLRDSMSTRTRVTNLGEDTAEEEPYISEENDSILEVGLLEQPISEKYRGDAIFSTVDRKRERDAAKMKNVDRYGQSLLELEAKKIKLLEKDMSEVEDEDLLFFRSLLRDFKSLPREKRLLLKIKYQQLLYDEVVSNSKTSTILS